MLAMLFTVSIVTFVWSAYKNEDNEQEIRKTASKTTLYIFYGSALLLIIITLIFGM